MVFFLQLFNLCLLLLKLCFQLFILLTCGITFGGDGGELCLDLMVFTTGLVAAACPPGPPFQIVNSGFFYEIV